MSRKIKLNPESFLWEGYILDITEKRALTDIVMEEFKLPVANRRSSEALVTEARLVAINNNKYKENECKN